MQRKASRQAVSPGRRGTSSTSDAGRTAGGKAAGRKPVAAKAGPAAKPARAKAAPPPKAPVGKKAVSGKAKAPAGKKAPVAAKAGAKAPAAVSSKANAKAPVAAKPKAPARPKAKSPAARPAKARAASRLPKARPSAAPVLPIHPIAASAPPAPPPPPLDRSSVGHRGLRELDWNGFAAVARELAARIGARFRPDLVVGLAKGGIFVGEELARALARPFVAVQLEKRSRDGGVRRGGPMPDDLLDRRVLLVDDVAGTGEALAAAVELAVAAGASEVRTAAVIARPGRFRPDFAVEETNDLWVLPWDYEPPNGVGTPAGGAAE